MLVTSATPWVSNVAFTPGSAMTKPVTRKSNARAMTIIPDFFMKSLLLLLPIFSAIVRSYH